jgi:hypothetical protein
VGDVKIMWPLGDGQHIFFHHVTSACTLTNSHSVKMGGTSTFLQNIITFNYFHVKTNSMTIT